MDQKLKDLLIKQAPINEKSFLPNNSVDCVVFGFDGSSLYVLLIKLFGEEKWMLPGGYIGHTEDIDTSAKRVLKERTGASDIFLTQFKTYGSNNRLNNPFPDLPYDLFYNHRFITCAFYALINFDLVKPSKDEFSDFCEWKPISSIPELMMDHEEIISDALSNLQKDLNYKPIGLNLLPEKFTMPELLSLYETILQKKLIRANFYRKMKKYDILEKLDETKTGGAHKSPTLYKFDKEKFNKALENGLQQNW